MASLADERLRRLHKWFLDTAERFLDLHFAAVTVAKQPEWLPEENRWPLLPYGVREQHLGLTGKDWLGALNKPAGTPFTPIKSVWLQIAGRLWEGGFLNGKRVESVDGLELNDDFKAQFFHLQEAIAEFERLAGMAAGHFEMPPWPTPGVDFPLESKPAHRWLEAVAGMPFVSVENRLGFLVREVPGDLFTASARAIEILGSAGGRGCGADSTGLTGNLIERLLAGQEDAELTPRESALLSAYLENYQLSLSDVQQEKRATGESTTLEQLRKLRTIRDFNRNLQSSAAPPTPKQATDATKGETISASLAAQLDALNQLSLAYQSARDFTLPVLRTAFGDPPPSPPECVWPPPGVAERDAQSRLHWICNFLNQCEGLIRTTVREIKAAQVRFVATGFDVPRSWIMVNPLETFMGGMVGACGVIEIVKSVAAEDAAIVKILEEISVDLVLLKGKVANLTLPAAKPGPGGGNDGTGSAMLSIEVHDSRATDPDFDRKFMEMAVEEARKSKPEDGRVHPKVGVVVVKEGHVLATAYRGELAQGEHAEFTALEKKLHDETVAGATVYTTLEPCTSRNHPKLPCAIRLIERKVKRVVIGMHDPNRTVYGGGWARLQEAGIATADFDSDLKDEIKEMNRDFIRHHELASQGKHSELRQ